MKLVIKCLVWSVFILGTVSCSDDDDATPITPDPNVTFTASLDGASEVPPNTSIGAGTATLIFNSSTKIFTLTGTYTDVIALDGHVHRAAAGENGGVVFGLTTFSSPLELTSPALTTEQEADLNANLYYVNIHSAAFPGGEIRGQLIKQ